jgi:hypothetical protein
MTNNSLSFVCVNSLTCYRKEMSSAFSLYSAQAHTSLGYFSPLGHESVSPECEPSHLLYGLPELLPVGELPLAIRAIRSDVNRGPQMLILWPSFFCYMNTAQMPVVSPIHEVSPLPFSILKFSLFQYLFCSCGTCFFVSAARTRTNIIAVWQILTLRCLYKHNPLLYHLSFHIVQC